MPNMDIQQLPPAWQEKAEMLPLPPDELIAPSDGKATKYHNAIPTTGEDFSAASLKHLHRLVIITGIVLAWLASGTFTEFKEDAYALAGQAFLSLVILALIVERSVEVYIHNLRNLNRARLDRSVTGWTAFHTAVSDAFNAGKLQEKDVQIASNILEYWTIEQVVYRQKTAKISYMAATILGIFAALVGPRILSELVIVNHLMTDTDKLCQAACNPTLIIEVQYALFKVLDVMLTAGMIGGGAAGIHNMIGRMESKKDQ